MTPFQGMPISQNKCKSLTAMLKSLLKCIYFKHYFYISYGITRGSSCSFKRRREGTFEAEFMNSFRGKHRSFKNSAAMFDVTLVSGADDNVIDDNSVTSPPASPSRRKLKCSCDIQNELPNEENPSHFYL